MRAVLKNILSGFPDNEELGSYLKDSEIPQYRKANAHIHTPYSFSAFDDVKTALKMAADEKIDALGINDFFVTDGYFDFHEGCIKNNIFPLFNIEFIGLMKREQKRGIRINDPNNPGRIYFCGKGLDFPAHLSSWNRDTLERVKRETQTQLRGMTKKLNVIMGAINPTMFLDFDEIRYKFARELVRERHLAKAVRVLAEDSYPDVNERKAFYQSLFGNSVPGSGMNDIASLENEIRSRLLKAGGAAFVEEDEKSFLSIEKIIEIIVDAGGIPCYPVLLDDQAGKFTDFEADMIKLHRSLSGMGVGCIELIPGRNDHTILEQFVNYFYSKGFMITFGTEHNAPGMIPVTVTARRNTVLSASLMDIGWRGICAIAAHQYLRAKGMKGFAGAKGKALLKERDSLEKTGRSVIEYYLKNRNK